MAKYSNNFKDYHTLRRIISKEELRKKVDKLIEKAREKANASRLRKDEGQLYQEGDEQESGSG